jgi:hypothetical protein
MIGKLASVLLSASGLLLPADLSSQFLAGQKVQVAHTDHLSLPAGGTLRLQHSFGELNIEGWDRPDVEITTVKTTKEYYRTADSARGRAELERVHVTSEVEEKDIVVTTSAPHRGFPGLPWTEPSIDLEYRIKVPMHAAIVVGHGTGEVHFDHVAGDIRANVRSGGITLDLAPESKYAIEAKSDWGAAISDFPGNPHRRFWLVGHQFTRQSADGAHKLVLKAEYGDIILIKAWEPVATH